jgi:hypothetical protein
VVRSSISVFKRREKEAERESPSSLAEVVGVHSLHLVGALQRYPTLWAIMRLASISPSIRTTLSATLPTILAPLRLVPVASPTSPEASVPA